MCDVCTDHVPNPPPKLSCGLNGLSLQPVHQVSTQYGNLLLFVSLFECQHTLVSTWPSSLGTPIRHHLLLYSHICRFGFKQTCKQYLQNNEKQLGLVCAGCHCIHKLHQIYQMKMTFKHNIASRRDSPGASTANAVLEEPPAVTLKFCCRFGVCVLCCRMTGSLKCSVHRRDDCRHNSLALSIGEPIALACMGIARTIFEIWPPTVPRFSLPLDGSASLCSTAHPVTFSVDQDPRAQA